MRKNFFKKVLAVTLASTMAFSMAGCGNSDSKNFVFRLQKGD